MTQATAVSGPATPDTPGTSFAHRGHGRGRAAIRGWLWALVTVTSTAALSALVFVVVSRALAPADYGGVAMAMAAVALLGAVLPTAFGDALVQRPEVTQHHLSSVFWLVLGAALLAYGGLALAAPAMERATGTAGLALFLQVIGVKLVLDAIACVPAALLLRRMAFSRVALRTTLSNLIGAGLCLGLVWGGWPIWGLVLAQVVAPAVGMAVALGTAGWRPRLLFDRAALATLAPFGTYAIGGRVLNEARIDQILLGALVGPAALGLFYFARRLFQLLTDVTAGAFAGVGAVLFASLQADPDKRRLAFETASFGATAIGFPVFAGLIVLAPQALPLLFGAQWGGAVVAVQCFGVIGLMAALGVIQAEMIRNLGQPGWWFRYQALSQITGWGLILVLAPHGLDAVMIALALRTCALWPLSVRKAARMLDLPLSRYVAALSAPALSTLAGAGAVLALPLLPGVGAGLGGGLGNWGHLATQAALGLIVYVGALCLLGRGRIAGVLAQIRHRTGAHP